MAYGAPQAEPETTEPAQEAPDAEAAPAVELPSLAKRIEWVDDWEQKTRESRKLARNDRRYYDGYQWTKEELDQLKERRQPPVTKNQIAPAINFIRGEEIKKRVDPVARPRTPQHEDSARAATDALRYVKEEQGFDLARSAVLKNALIEGYGGAIKSIEQDAAGELRHKLLHVEWDRLFYDPHSRAPDFSDAKYLGIIRWADLDDAIADYPEKEEALRSALTVDISPMDDTTEDTPRRWVDKKRQRVKICEMYFCVADNWYRADFTGADDLREPGPTVYSDEAGATVCPLIMMSCYVDAEGMRYGVVRSLISPQDEINKRSSKFLHLISVRQVIAERDFIRQPEEFMENLAKPDGYAEVEPGGMSEGRVQISQTGDMAAGQFQLLQEAIASFQRVAPAAAQVPDAPGGSSGRAILARQQASSQELGSLFDHLRMWTQSVYELDWLCIRQYWTEEKWLRVTDDQELTGYRFVAINRPMTRAERYQELMQKGSPPDVALDSAAGNLSPQVMFGAKQQAQQMAMQAQQAGQQVPPEQAGQMTQALILRHPLMQQQITQNQIDQMEVDLVIDETQESAVLEQEEFEKFAEVMPTLVQGGLDPREASKMMVQLSQLRDKKKVLAMLEKPSVDPQAQQMQQMAQQLQQTMAQLQAALTQAEVGKVQSETELNKAKTQLTLEQAGAEGPASMAAAQHDHSLAIKHAAEAGQLAGGGGPPQGAMQ
jgi:hypothetical protein